MTTVVMQSNEDLSFSIDGNCSVLVGNCSVNQVSTLMWEWSFHQPNVIWLWSKKESGVMFLKINLINIRKLNWTPYRFGPRRLFRGQNVFNFVHSHIHKVLTPNVYKNVYTNFSNNPYLGFEFWKNCRHGGRNPESPSEDFLHAKSSLHYQGYAFILTPD